MYARSPSARMVMDPYHSITPPPELVGRLKHLYVDDAIMRAYQAGADAELDAVIDVILSHPGFEQPELFVELLRAARRPKPPSLKEQALQCLKNIDDACESEGFSRSEDTDIIRRALESLPE